MGQRGWGSLSLVCPALCGIWGKPEALGVVAELWDGKSCGGCQGTPDQAPHPPAGSGREREEEEDERGVVQTLLGAGQGSQGSWRGCAGRWHSLGVTLSPAFEMWQCDPALVWADTSLPAQSGSRASRDIRWPFLSFLFRAAPLCFPFPCRKHGLEAGSKPCKALKEPGRLRASPQHGTGRSRSSLSTARRSL